MDDYPHFTLGGLRTSEPYTAIGQGGSHASPPRPQQKSHGDKLLADLERAERIAKSRRDQEAVREGLQFIPMRFGESAEFQLELKRLENERQGIADVVGRSLQRAVKLDR